MQIATPGKTYDVCIVGSGAGGATFTTKSDFTFKRFDTVTVRTKVGCPPPL